MLLCVLVPTIMRNLCDIVFAKIASENIAELYLLNLYYHTKHQNCSAILIAVCLVKMGGKIIH